MAGLMGEGYDGDAICRDRSTFLEKVRRAELGPDNIDQEIDAWHMLDGGNLDLHEFLGFTWKEWQHFVSDSKSFWDSCKKS